MSEILEIFGSSHAFGKSIRGKQILIAWVIIMVPFFRSRLKHHIWNQLLWLKSCFIIRIKFFYCLLMNVEVSIWWTSKNLRIVGTSITLLNRVSVPVFSMRFLVMSFKELWRLSMLLCYVSLMIMWLCFW